MQHRLGWQLHCHPGQDRGSRLNRRPNDVYMLGWQLYCRPNDELHGPQAAPLHDTHTTLSMAVH
jgi:hypothetical protein